MTKRWGTALEQWTADPNEYEFVEENVDIRKGKPVRDPFQEQPPSRKQNNSIWTSKIETSTVDGDESMLKRARRNQERLQRERRPQKELPEEFYDEDDEGYELPAVSSDGYNSLAHLIAPQPVGGRGSNMETPNEDVSSRGPGFFFNNRVDGTEKLARDVEARSSEEENQKKPRNQPVSVPVLDEFGNPMYLSALQAQQFFQSQLSCKDLARQETQPAARSWQELGITSPQLLTNLQSMSCSSPLPVQDKTCPSVLTGNDVLVGTYTGSGKTLCFLVPLVQRLLFRAQNKNDEIDVLVVAPGRELASQIASVARSLLEGTDLTVMLSIGGTTFGRNLAQIRKRKPSILVGTPGRIAELVVGRPGEKSGRLKVGNLQTIVLDEFDALLEYKPHRDPTRAVLTMLKKRHGDSLQSILCSATASDLVDSQDLETFLRPGYSLAMADRDDQLITVEGDKSVARVSRTVIHGVIHLSHRRFALETLRRVLHTEPLPQQVLIFADTARRVDLVVEKLGNMGIIAAPLHGGFGSEKVDRADVAKALREGNVGIVVATELAARGLDAPLLTHVINLDLPTDASHYAHRAGRCGRGGRPGVVINITTNRKERNVPQKFADRLGITMHTAEARSGRLHIVEPNQRLDKSMES